MGTLAPSLYMEPDPGEEHWESEEAARRYLLGFCWDNYQRHCPRCRGRRLSRLPDRRWRCRRCRYPFHDFTGRWINQGRLTCTQWLRLLRLFAQERPVPEMAATLGLAYNTTYKAVTTVRQAITARWTDPKEQSPGFAWPRPELSSPGESRGRAEGGSTSPVFGVREEGGRVRVRLLPSIRDRILHYLEVKKVRKGTLMYTDRFAEFDSLLCCSRARLDAEGGKPPRTGVYLDTDSGFWRYARAKLTRHRGITPERFPLYLKELEFRYNHRNEDLFPTLARYLCDFVPPFGG